MSPSMRSSPWRWLRSPRSQEETRVRLSIDVHHHHHSRRDRATRVVIPADLVMSAFRQLFPAERMIMFGGHRSASLIRVTSMVDVTLDAAASGVHVRACASRLGAYLLDLEKTGAQLVAWMHSHPGVGPASTRPSATDIRQEGVLRDDYSNDLISIIAVADGWFRLWGSGIDRRGLKISWQGQGIAQSKEVPNVFRLQPS